MTAPDEPAEEPLVPIDSETLGSISVFIDMSALGVIVALSVVMALGVTGLGRVLLALAFSLYVPGRAVLTLLPTMRATPHLGLSVVLSISVLVIVSVVALFVHLWQPDALYGVEAALSFVAISFSLARDFLEVGYESSGRIE